MTVTADRRSVLDPAPSSQTTRPARDDEKPEHPYRAGLWVMLAGYTLMTLVLLAVGFLLARVLDGSVGQWDQNVNENFARGRAGVWDDVTAVGTGALNTVPVVVAASLVVALLSLRRRFAEAAFLSLALLLEISVFLSVTFLVARPRPAVHRLDSTPATSSFPSGHTAAATVLFVGIALIVVWCTRSTLIRVAGGLLGTAFAVAVAFSRVYRGLHHPTDVFVGMLFGLACLAFAALAVRSARQRMHRVDDQKKRLIGLTAVSAAR